MYGDHQQGFVGPPRFRNFQNNFSRNDNGGDYYDGSRRRSKPPLLPLPSDVGLRPGPGPCPQQVSGIPRDPRFIRFEQSRPPAPANRHQRATHVNDNPYYDQHGQAASLVSFDEQHRGSNMSWPSTYHGCISYNNTSSRLTMQHQSSTSSTVVASTTGENAVPFAKRQRTVNQRSGGQWHDNYDNNQQYWSSSPVRASKTVRRNAGGASGGSNERETDFDADDLTVTIQCKPNSKEPVERQDNSFFATGTVFCETCNVSFAEKTEYNEHLSSASHVEQYNLFCKLHQKKTEHLTAKSECQEKTSSAKLSAPNVEHTGGKFSFCKTCKSQYQGDVVKHRQSSDHKANKVLLQPYCTQCSMFLRSPAKFILHCNSPRHTANRNKSKELQIVVLESAATDALPAETGNGGDGDRTKQSEGDAIVCAQKMTIKKSDDVIDTSTKRPTADLVQGADDQKLNFPASPPLPSLSDPSTVDKEDKKTLVPDSSTSVKSEPRNPVGTSCVIAIKGFYCTVCSKLFTDKYTARIVHCQSKLHHDNFKAKNVSQETEKWQTINESHVELVVEGQDKDTQALDFKREK